MNITRCKKIYAILMHIVCINASEKSNRPLFCWSHSPAACFMMSTWSSKRHHTLLAVLSHSCINVLLNIKRISAHQSGPIHLHCGINIIGPLMPAPPALTLDSEAAQDGWILNPSSIPVQ